jgi:hypothetical protein
LAGAVRRFRCWIDNQLAFPDVYAESGKWFHRAAKWFRRRGRTKQSSKNSNDFSPMELTERLGTVLERPLSFTGLAVQWPSAATTSGAGARIGVPLQLKVPTPGRSPSAEPAKEGPVRTKMAVADGAHGVSPLTIWK